MDSSNVPMPSQKRTNQIQGPRPSALKLNQDSHKIRKPPLPPHRPNPSRPLPQQPVIIYAVSPKVIHADVSEFMSVVQRLTGLSSTDFTSGPNGSLSPAARLAATERASPRGAPQRVIDSSAPDPVSSEGGMLELREEVEVGLPPSILSPAPAMLPPIPSGYFSPSDPNALSFLNDIVLSPWDCSGMSGGSSFLFSPSGLFATTAGFNISPLTSPDLFNNFPDM